MSSTQNTEKNDTQRKRIDTPMEILVTEQLLVVLALASPLGGNKPLFSLIEEYKIRSISVLIPKDRALVSSKQGYNPKNRWRSASPHTNMDYLFNLYIIYYINASKENIDSSSLPKIKKKIFFS